MTNGRMTITEARRATEFIGLVDVEESRLTTAYGMKTLKIRDGRFFNYYVFSPRTLLSLHISFTLTCSRYCIASSLSLKTAGYTATAFFTSARTKVVEIVIATIAFITGDAGFAETFTLPIAL